MSASDGHYPYVGDDPAGVASAITDLDAVAGALATLGGEVEHDTASIQQYWPKGHTVQVAAGDAARIGGALDECHLVFARAGQDLGDLREVLVMARRTVDDLNDAHRVLTAAQLAFQGPFGATFGTPEGPQYLLAQGALRVAQARSGFESVADIDTAYARIQAHVVEETGLCNQLLSRLTAQGCPPVGRAGFTGGVSKYDGSFGLLAAWSGRQVADILAGYTSFPSDPKAVNDAWEALSEDQQDELLAGDPARFGNLNGIPAKDRDTANRLVLKNQVARIQAALVAAGMSPTTKPEVFETWDAEGQVRILGGDIFGTQTNRVREAMANAGMSMDQAKHALRVNQQLNPIDGTPAGSVHLLAYQPGADDNNGRAAIAYGEVDGADNVAVCVPGLNSTLGNVQNVSGDALNLFNAAKLADPSKRTAVIAWQGYNAPNFLEMGFQDKAEAGSKLLAAEVNALRVTHDGTIKGKVTVVAHSYGSTVASLALQREHMHVDQGIFIGSPGMGGDAKTAADLGLDKNTMFVGSASRDIVTSATRGFGHSLGADPTLDKFGESVTRFKTEDVNRGVHINFADHSLYYDADTQSESLYSLSSIVVGDGHLLGQEGMLAEPRHTVHDAAMDDSGGHDWVADSEGHRTPTAGHDHANDPVSP